MARCTCPSCGASWNGKRCRSCNYEHFSEEIAHRGHTHRGEPLIIDAPARNPIPTKDPFGCETRTKKTAFPRREKKQRPFAGLMTIFLLIYALLPLVRSWGLELEAREEAYRMEQALPEDLVTLHEEGPITISTQSRCLNEFPDSGLRLWVKNERKADVYLTAKYVMADGFVLPNTGLFMECSAGSTCLDTLYLDGENLQDAGISQVREISFVLVCVSDSQTVLFETDPITVTRDIPEPKPPEFDAPVLLDADGLRILDLSYLPNPDHPGYENGWLLFYMENNTGELLTVSSLGSSAGGQAVDLFLWSNLPAHSKAVVRVDLLALEKLTFTTPSELGDLEMTLEFRNPDNSGTVREYTITRPMASRETVVIS